MPWRTPVLVGRDDELRRLATVVGAGAEPGASPGGMALVTGDAGIGKSRLVDAVAERAQAAGWLVVVGHCVGQGGSAVAYLPVLEIVAAIETAMPELVAQLSELHPSLARLRPGPVTGEGDTPAADPSHVAEAVHALLVALGRSRPALVIVEDAHWADHSTRDLLTLVLTRGFAAPVSLVVTVRSDDLHRRHPLHETMALWSRLPRVEHVEVPRLGDEAIRELLVGLGLQAADAVTAEIVRRAEGNPFFAEELADTGGDTAALRGGLGRVLRARVEQLSDTAQQVLQAVAVWGRRIDHELLARVVDLSDAALDAAVAEAVERLVLEATWPPGYAFRHALLAEAVVDTALPGQRLRLHRAYAAVLDERPDLGNAAELARHAAAGGDTATAIRAGRAAAEQALAVGGPHDALQHLERVLRWLPGDADESLRDEVTLRASDAAYQAGEVLRAIALLRDRLDHPEPGQSRRGRGVMLAQLASRSRVLDLPLDRLELTTEAMALAGEGEDAAGVGVRIAHLQQLVDAGRTAEALALGAEATALAERLGMAAALTEIRTVLMGTVWDKEDLAAAERHLRSILADSTDPTDPTRIRIGYQLAAARLQLGDLAGAQARFDDSAALARRLGREWAPWALDCQLLAGLTAYARGDWPGASRRLAHGCAHAPDPGRALFAAAELILHAGRGLAEPLGTIDELRRWWPVDLLSAVLTVVAGIDLLGSRGELEAALALTADAVAALDRGWGSYQAIVRIGALVCGQVADAAPALDRAELGEAARYAGELADRAERVLAELLTRRTTPESRQEDAPDNDRRGGSGGADVAVHSAIVVGASGAGGGGAALAARDGDGVAVDEGWPDLAPLATTSRETWAWATRLRAERGRLERLAGPGPGPEAGELVRWWERSVRAFENAGHVYERARSQVRLAEAHRWDGSARAAAAVAAEVRHTATRLGAGSLERLLEPPPASSATARLTPREAEVLVHVARGLSNGQVATRLRISTKTVSVHVSNVLAKLGATSRTEAVALAREEGLLE